jgi:hypothetical protein
MKQIFMVCFVCTVLVACGATGTRGDGQADNRYAKARSMISIADVDLGRDVDIRYPIPQLPSGERFVLGLHVAAGQCDFLHSSRRVAIQLTEEHGRVVIDVDRPLNEFKWSRGRDECVPAFGYLRGEGRSVPIPGTGDVCNEPIYSGADFGYGSQFVARNDAAYVVRLKIYGNQAVGPAQPAQLSLAFDGRHELKTCPK